MVRLTPRGGRDVVEGWATDAAGRALLKVRVRAAPTDGQANAALIALVAKALDRPRSAIRIVSGETTRLKIIEIDGVDQAELDAVLGAPSA